MPCDPDGSAAVLDKCIYISLGNWGPHVKFQTTPTLRKVRFNPKYIIVTRIDVTSARQIGRVKSGLSGFSLFQVQFKED
jgi:hypothetical protein